MSDEIAIGHLQKRKIEARVLIPFITACREKLGDGPTREAVAATIRTLAAEEGAKWAGGGGLDIQVLDQTGDRLAFNVTRCRYAEFYKELGLADLGSLIHCSRDHAMVAGFNDGLELARSQTIMEGGSCCDFCFRRKT
jgi:hypothetical protein